MKKVVCILLALLMLSTSICAIAEAGRIEEWRPDLLNLKVDVAVDAVNNPEIYASIDGSEPVKVPHEEISPDVGHIIVIDVAWTWSTTLSVENIVVPPVDAYLSLIDSESKVKFILANGNSPTETNYMTVSQARQYVRNTVKLPDQRFGNPWSTCIDAALRSAFVQAGQYKTGEPLYKNVFALVDLANPNIATSATSVRRAYKETGNSFPLMLVTVYPETFMNGDGKNTNAGKNIVSGMEKYQNLARENDTVLVSLNFKNGETLSTAGISEMMHNRNYYTLDLSALQPYIDYTTDKHQIVVQVSNGRNGWVDNTMPEIRTDALPTPVPTAAPTSTPVPIVTVAPTATPVPYVVQPGDSGNEAKLVINKLYMLYYLQVEKNQLPGEFDVNCQYAFMEFCRMNGLPQQDNVTLEAYELLMSENALPAPTATPVPTPTVAPATPEPTAQPRIYIGASSTHALRAIKKLQELYYLDENGKYSTWDSECMLAFQTLCADNNMDYDHDYVDDPMYDWLVDGNLRPRATATPIPEVTPVPEPTIPPEGYVLGSMDGDDADFIAQMQRSLQGLGLYSSEMIVGTVDQATLDAVARYCQYFGLNMKNPYNIEKTIATDIIKNGGDRVVPATPEPTLAENFTGFLQKEVLALGSFSVKTWMLLVLAIVLIFAILLIIILTHKKPDDHTGLSQSVSLPRKTNAMPFVPPPVGGYGSQNNAATGEETVPRSRGAGNDFDNDKTMPLGSGINVTLTITGGPSAGTRRALIGSKNYVIGRQTHSGNDLDLALEGDASISRKHAVLRYVNRQLCITNLSSNGTSVNGRSLESQSAPINSDETLPLGSSSSANADGYVLKSGDVIEMSGYQITVTW